MTSVMLPMNMKRKNDQEGKLKLLNANNNFRKERDRFKEKKGNLDNENLGLVGDWGLVAHVMEEGRLIQMEVAILDH